MNIVENCLCAVQLASLMGMAVLVSVSNPFTLGQEQGTRRQSYLRNILFLFLLIFLLFLLLFISMSIILAALPILLIP